MKDLGISDAQNPITIEAVYQSQNCVDINALLEKTKKSPPGAPDAAKMSGPSLHAPERVDSRPPSRSGRPASSQPPKTDPTLKPDKHLHKADSKESKPKIDPKVASPDRVNVHKRVLTKPDVLLGDKASAGPAGGRSRSPQRIVSAATELNLPPKPTEKEVPETKIIRALSSYLPPKPPVMKPILPTPNKEDRPLVSAKELPKITQKPVLQSPAKVAAHPLPVLKSPVRRLKQEERPRTPSKQVPKPPERPQSPVVAQIPRRASPVVALKTPLKTEAKRLGSAQQARNALVPQTKATLSINKSLHTKEREQEIKMVSDLPDSSDESFENGVQSNLKFDQEEEHGDQHMPDPAPQVVPSPQSPTIVAIDQSPVKIDRKLRASSHLELPNSLPTKQFRVVRSKPEPQSHEMSFFESETQESRPAHFKQPSAHESGLKKSGLETAADVHGGFLLKNRSIENSVYSQAKSSTKLFKVSVGKQIAAPLHVSTVKDTSERVMPPYGGNTAAKTLSALQPQSKPGRRFDSSVLGDRANLSASQPKFVQTHSETQDQELEDSEEHDLSKIE